MIRDFGDADAAQWDAYVRAHPHGSPFHLIAWKKTVEEGFGYPGRFLLAERDGAIRGILPLFLVKNLLMGKVLLSSPFAVYGGVLAADDETRAAFRDHLSGLGRSLGVQYVELRNAFPEQCLGFSKVERYVTFTQEIGSDEEAILEHIPRKTRAAVRKSLKFELAARSTRERRTFERLYGENLRRLGTPCFPSRHFAAILRHFGAEVDIRETLRGDQVIAAVLSFYFRDQVLPYYGASDASALAYQPNNFMYFDLMRRAGANGFRLFDFGRSKIDSGSFDFKAHWGMRTRTLPYEMLLVKRKDPPHFSPNNPKFQLAIRIWQRVPLGITRLIGPWLNRLVP